MSGIVALIGAPSADAAAEHAALMLRAMERRGNARVEMWCDGGTVLAVARHDWEREPGCNSPPPLIVATDGVVVVADASLYYRDDLRGRLRAAGVEPRGPSASHLILAAYEAWGPDCAGHLEGDFAFVLWDRRRSFALLARDFGGRRALHYTTVGTQLIVASTPSGVVAHPACSTEVDLTAVAAAATGLLGGSTTTAFRAVSPVLAGTSLVRRSDGALRIATRWAPPPFVDTGGTDPTEAAEELRDLLARAVAERMSHTGTTCVWMSGGWDSTAIFGAGQYHLASCGEGSRLRPVSVTFPEGDPAREDDHIEAIAARWGSTIEWIVADEVSPFTDIAERAARRDDPYAHTFEQIQRTLAARSRMLGARVALDGFGGDQLFQVSDVVLADDLRAGRWKALAEKWRGRREQGPRAFFSTCVKPILPDQVLSALGTLRGRPIGRVFEQQIAPWIRATTALRDIARHAEARAPGEGAAAYETRAMLESPYMPRALGWAFGFGLEEGVELRAPFYDQRLIEFAATRPAHERYSGSETKVLLRRAMVGLLPESVLAPRPFKTGIPSQYLRRQLQASLAPRFTALFGRGAQLSQLERLELIDVERLRGAVREYERTGAHLLGVQLYLTLEAELWLRAHLT